MLTVEQVADITQTCSRWIREQIKAGHLHAHRFGRLVRIAPEDLEVFIKMHRR
ncbi:MULTISPECIES: helix-turn-helix domain-containing protein [Azospirillum]|uniref:helix-turn-helix domain-containing protein n=1 Tax=Azospirillum sp. TSH58 TaxID=664962 RepID=UPI001304DC61|nr:helix-turn-helix domain-containing protein [Azospirillum sp. TSH58]